MSGFTAKERLRFRKLLEVAHSTTYSGERDAAMGAAERLASSHGMSLREAAGMAEEEAPPVHKPQHHRKPSGFPADFGAAGPETMGTWWTPRGSAGRAEAWRTEGERVAAEKKRRDEALAEALRRGLDADERAAKARAEAAKKRSYVRTPNRNAWRPRPEFVRVLLTETCMTAKEIAAVAGVTIYDVFREKLLMRRPRAAG